VPGSIEPAQEVRAAELQSGAKIKFTVVLSPYNVGMGLLVVAAGLMFLSVTGHALQFFFGRDRFIELVRLINLGGEQNLPTWYTSVILFMSALLLAYIAKRRHHRDRAYTRHWQFLALIFAYLSLDAVAVIHDRTLEQPLIEALQPGGVFHFPWVILGWGFVIGLGLIYYRFLFHLPRQVRILFMTAAIFFLGGGLILEMGSAYLMDRHVEAILLRGAVATVQEFAEMLGLVIFIYALLTYIGQINHDRQRRQAVAGRVGH
jgi:hypothetical protein